MLYKKKYIIALYNRFDYLYCVADNANDLSKIIHRSPNNINSSLAHHIEHFIVKGEKYRIYLIEFEEKE